MKNLIFISVVCLFASCSAYKEAMLDDGQTVMLCSAPGEKKIFKSLEEGDEVCAKHSMANNYYWLTYCNDTNAVNAKIIASEKELRKEERKAEGEGKEGLLKKVIGFFGNIGKGDDNGGQVKKLRDDLKEERDAKKQLEDDLHKANARIQELEKKLNQQKPATQQPAQPEKQKTVKQKTNNTG